MMRFREYQILKFRWFVLTSLMILRSSSAFQPSSARLSIRLNSYECCLNQCSLTSEKSKCNSITETNTSRSDFISNMILTCVTVVTLSTNPTSTSAIETTASDVHVPSDNSSAKKPLQNVPIKTDKSSDSKSFISLTSFQESVSGFVSGAALTTAKTLGTVECYIIPILVLLYSKNIFKKSLTFR